MAIKITDECINCGACEPECPNNAIYEGGVEWAMSDGTTVKGSYVLMDGTVVDADQKFAPISSDTYYITPNKCTECQGFHEEPQVLHYGKAGTGAVIKAGMCFTIEPMINAGKPQCSVLKDDWTVVTKDRSLSAQWEHTLLVTEDGCEVLTLRKDEELDRVIHNS